MSRRVLVGVLLLVLIVVLAGCDPKVNIENLTGQVKASILNEYGKTHESVEILDLTLLHEDGKVYRGVLVFEVDGIEQSLPIRVTCDGESFMWETGLLAQ
jgi:hypothetical protein